MPWCTDISAARPASIELFSISRVRSRLQKGRFSRIPLFSNIYSLIVAVLILTAIQSSCKGFFVNPTLSSISIQPPSPLVEVGKSEALQAWGTYSDDSRSQITSGVVWSTSDITTVSIDPNRGVIQGEGTGGTATITVAAQGLSATATATAYLGTISNFEICDGTFNAGTCPASTWSLTTSGGYQYFYVRVLITGVPLTSQRQRLLLHPVHTFHVTTVPLPLSAPYQVAFRRGAIQSS